MKKSLLSILILLPLVVCGMDLSAPLPRDCGKKIAIDNCNLRITYRVKLAQDTVKKNYILDNQALEVGDKYTRYYSLFAENIDSVMWKSRQKSSSGDQGIDVRKNLQRNEDGTFEDIFMNYPIRSNSTDIRRFVQKDYEYTEVMPSQQWKIEFVFDTILGYSCQRATTNFRGRDYTAWFASDIPVSQGPWKFSGLPGLILKVADTKGLFEFTAIGIKQPRNEKIYKYDLPTIKSSRKDVRKLLDMRWSDPVGLIQANFTVANGSVRFGRDSKEASKPGDVKLPYIPQLELE